MGETNLQGLRAAMNRSVAPDFTAQIFTRIGVDRYMTAASALGNVFVAWRATGVCAVRTAVDAAAFERWYGERFGRRVVEAVEDDPTSRAAREKLAGRPADVPIDLSECSPFERRVLEKAGFLPTGRIEPSPCAARGEPALSRRSHSLLRQARGDAGRHLRQEPLAQVKVPIGS